MWAACMYKSRSRLLSCSRLNRRSGQLKERLRGRSRHRAIDLTLCYMSFNPYHSRASDFTDKFRVQATHYKLSSQKYGGFTFDSIGRASHHGVSTVDPLYPPLNTAPSGVYLPHGMGKTVGQNGAP